MACLETASPVCLFMALLNYKQIFSSLIFKYILTLSKKFSHSSKEYIYYKIKLYQFNPTITITTALALLVELLEIVCILVAYQSPMFSEMICLDEYEQHKTNIVMRLQHADDFQPLYEQIYFVSSIGSGPRTLFLLIAQIN